MVEVQDYLKPLMLKDLRTQCRARGLNPGGSRQALAERLAEHMVATQDFTIFSDASGGAPQHSSAAADEPHQVNNYGRPDGQNVGNYLTDRPTSRVLAPPGGASQVHFGNYATPSPQAQQPSATSPALADVSNQDYMAAHKSSPQQTKASVQSNHAGIFGHGMSHGIGQEVNNYSRPEGQNVGNFLSDRPSSRVLAPPGGASQVFFG